MTLDDNSILSAYLDGELGPEQQQAVESALVADPQLAEEVRAIAVLRDLVSGLPREAPPDVTARVMRRIRRRALLGTARGAVAWAPLRASSLAAVAAGVLVAVALLPGLLHVGPRPAGNEVPVAQVGPVENARPVVSSDRWPHLRANLARPGQAAPLQPGAGRAVATVSADRDGPDSGNLSYVREYLDDPRLRRVFMVSDPGDGSAEQRVARIVEETTRFNFYRITISQGIVVDPRHPDRATVFALVVGPRELHRLGEQLRTALNDRVEETAAEPAIVTQLADIGQVEALPPSPAAEMNIPRNAVMALREGEPGGPEAPETPRAEPNRADRPIPEQYHSMPNPELYGPLRTARTSSKPGPRPPVVADNRPADRPIAAKDTDQSLVVLVWVYRPREG